VEKTLIEGQSDREFVSSFAKGLSVICAFGRETPDMTLSEVAQKTGMTRAAARRFLLTLEALGYACADGKRFSLTPKVLELGFSYLSSMDVWDVAMPFMEQVTEEIRESCSASVLEGNDVVYVARVPTKRIMSVSLHLGARLPAFATSMGRVLLAALSDEDARAIIQGSNRTRFTQATVTGLDDLMEIVRTTRTQGYALVNQELEEGLCSVAVPLVNSSGRVLAALNVSGHSSRTTPAEMIESYLPALLRAQEGIAKAIV